MHHIIYKIFRHAEWSAFEAAARFDGSPDDLRDGYIHFSALPQLRETVRRYYADEPSIVLAVIPLASLHEADLRWEAARGDQLFPHLYQPLLRDQVVAAKQCEPSAVIAMTDVALGALFAPL